MPRLSFLPHSPTRPLALPHTRPQTHRRPRPPLGLSLVEVLVALVLLAIGALGVASTSAFATRLSATGQLLVGATRDLGQIVDSLRIVPCSNLAAGGATTAHGSATWSVNRAANSASLAVTIVPATLRLSTPLVSETIVPCE